jgi:hypothetical protein
VVVTNVRYNGAIHDFALLNALVDAPNTGTALRQARPISRTTFGEPSTRIVTPGGEFIRLATNRFPVRGSRCGISASDPILRGREVLDSVERLGWEVNLYAAGRGAAVPLSAGRV